jgi:hypothetical protein
VRVDKRFEPISIFDWYDGILVGLVSLTWKEGTFLASALAWSQEDRMRVFALIGIGPSDSDQLYAIFQGEWTMAVAQLKEFCLRVTDDVIIVCYDERKDEIISETTLPIKDVRNQLVSSIDEVLDPIRSQWLEICRNADWNRS